MTDTAIKPRRKLGWLAAFVAIVLAVCAAAAGLYWYRRRANYPIVYLYERQAIAAAEEFDVPPAIVLAIMYAESYGNPTAKSHAGAVGLMQLLPGTAREIAEDRLKETYDEAMLTDPVTNLRWGAFYLRHLYNKYGDWRTTFAAYNGGLGNVDKWITAQGGTPGSDPVGDIPFPETAGYVVKVERARGFYQRRIDRQQRTEEK